jgi:hypothetical protein
MRYIRTDVVRTFHKKVAMQSTSIKPTIDAAFVSRVFAGADSGGGREVKEGGAREFLNPTTLYDALILEGVRKKVWCGVK